MSHGHFVLVGPTTGLGGFFLGPLWYYVGLPGFLLSGGNPYGICLWIISLSCLAIPLYWYVSQKLFGGKSEKKWAVLSAFLLATIPGSIQASIFTWNVVMDAPLMLGALISFWKVRENASASEKHSQKWLALGFFFLALALQSEFAYAVFFLPILFVLVPFLRRKFDVHDFLIAICAVGITLIPQGLFELRNHFIMTQSLLKTMRDSSMSVSWAQQFADRPYQLYDTTRMILLGESMFSNYLVPVILGLAIIGVFFILRHFILTLKKKNVDQLTFEWFLLALFAIIPYPFFLIWRGNHGYFFWYYITCHFVFLIPLFVFGAKKFISLFSFFRPLFWLSQIAIGLAIVSILFVSIKHWNTVIANPDNNAGLYKMVTAVGEVYQWQKEDGVPQSTVRIFTANVYTEQYDYLFQWYAKAHHIPVPLTTRSGNEKVWYLVMESKDAAYKVFFVPWYQSATAGGILVRHDQVGVLTLETWKANNAKTAPIQK